MSGIRKFARDTMIYGATTILSRLLNFVLTPFFVHKFAVSVYGALTKMYAYASMVNALLAFGMETTYFRYLQKVEGEQQKVFDSSFFITLITALLFLGSVFTFTSPIALWLNESGGQTAEYVIFVKFFAGILAADAVAVVPFAKLRAQGRPVRYGLIKIVNILVFVGLNLFFLSVLPGLIKGSEFWRLMTEGWFIEGWLGNVFIANLVASLVTLLLLFPQMVSFRFRMDLPLIRSMIAYSFPVLVANISFIINENLDKMMIPRLMPQDQGDVDIGIYGAVTKLAVFLNLFVTAFRLGAEPFFFAHAKNENAKKTYALIMKYFVIAMLLVMLGICANIDWLKYFIKGKDEQQQLLYWSGLPVIPILLFNFVLLGIYMNLSVWYKLSDQTKYALYISGLGALLTIVLNLLLIPDFSYYGAAISTTLTYVLMVCLSFFWGQRNYKIPYQTPVILWYLLIGLGFSILAFNTNFWLGNLLFLIALALTIKVEMPTLLPFFRKK